jgi:hypothetical protein
MEIGVLYFYYNRLETLNDHTHVNAEFSGISGNHRDKNESTIRRLRRLTRIYHFN